MRSMTFTLRGHPTLAAAEKAAHVIVERYLGPDVAYELDVHTEPSEYIVSGSSPMTAIQYWEARFEVVECE